MPSRGFARGRLGTVSLSNSWTNHTRSSKCAQRLQYKSVGLWPLPRSTEWSYGSTGCSQPNEEGEFMKSEKRILFAAGVIGCVLLFGWMVAHAQVASGNGNSRDANSQSQVNLLSGGNPLPQG